MESVWSEDLEDKQIDLWQQYECLYQELQAVTAIAKKRNAVHIAESVGSRRELVANSCTHRRRDETKQFRRVGPPNAQNLLPKICTTSPVSRR